MTRTADELLAHLATQGPPVLEGRETFSAVFRRGSDLYVSGQVAFRDGRLTSLGQVGADLSIREGQEAAWACAVNILTEVQKAVGSLDRVAATRMNVFVSSAPDCHDQHIVADAASRLIRSVLGAERGEHARTAIGVAALPLDSPVEIEAIFFVEDANGL